MATQAQVEQRRQAALSLHRKHNSKGIAARARRGLVLKHLQKTNPELVRIYTDQGAQHV